MSMAATAQTTREEMARDIDLNAGIYAAYPVRENKVTPAPKGYKPFYISHYGRHGSRYLISDRDYKVVMDRLNDAKAHDALTPLGESMLARMDTVWTEARGRGGELSPLGRRQHKGIARRMYQAYPEVFGPDGQYFASSTTVMRCAHSMFAFIEGLKECDPSLEIPRESGERDMHFLNYHTPESNAASSHDGPWYQAYKRLYAANTKPDRLMEAIFSDPGYVSTWVDPRQFMWDCYWVAADMQNMETPVRFYDIFTPEELYDLWEVANFRFFAIASSYATVGDVHVNDARSLVKDILDNADATVARGKGRGGKFRFGHDGNIIPLLGLLRVDSCYTDVYEPGKVAGAWNDFRVSPMGANLQIVLFRSDKPGAPVLAKVLHNEKETRVPVETDIWPFYKWEDLRAYMVSLLGE